MEDLLDWEPQPPSGWPRPGPGPAGHAPGGVDPPEAEGIGYEEARDAVMALLDTPPPDGRGLWSETLVARESGVPLNTVGAVFAKENLSAGRGRDPGRTCSGVFRADYPVGTDEDVLDSVKRLMDTEPPDGREVWTNELLARRLGIPLRKVEKIRFRENLSPGNYRKTTLSEDFAAMIDSHFEDLEILAREESGRASLRAEVILAVADGLNFADAARLYGENEVTVSRWYRRFAKEGIGGLLERSMEGLGLDGLCLPSLDAGTVSTTAMRLFGRQAGQGLPEDGRTGADDAASGTLAGDAAGSLEPFILACLELLDEWASAWDGTRPHGPTISLAANFPLELLTWRAAIVRQRLSGASVDSVTRQCSTSVATVRRLTANFLEEGHGSLLPLPLGNGLTTPSLIQRAKVTALLAAPPPSKLGEWDRETAAAVLRIPQNLIDEILQEKGMRLKPLPDGWGRGVSFVCPRGAPVTLRGGASEPDGAGPAPGFRTWARAAVQAGPAVQPAPGGRARGRGAVLAEPQIRDEPAVKPAPGGMARFRGKTQVEIQAQAEPSGRASGKVQPASRGRARGKAQAGPAVQPASGMARSWGEVQAETPDQAEPAVQPASGGRASGKTQAAPKARAAARGEEPEA
jgi:transposase